MRNLVVPLSKSFAIRELQSMRHIIFTAETHNFPTAIAPFQVQLQLQRDLYCLDLMC